MKSYYQHLESTKAIGENYSLSKKPVFRSSAIFPVLHNQDITTRVVFMGYWLLKRNISSIGFLYTLRDQEGGMLLRKYFLIDSAKGFTIDVAGLLQELEGMSDFFTGSLELEIFSTVDLVYPYPAFVVHYYSELFGTAVHTVGRIYNDIEDFKENNEYLVPEAGFDVYGSEGMDPFIAFTNGPIKNSNPKIHCQIINSKKQIVTKEFELPEIKPFETVFLNLKDYVDLDSILGSKSGTVKISHNLQGFFPRFVAGNFENNKKALSITHTYYDSSEVYDSKAYWNRADERFYDSSILIPFYQDEDLYTNMVLYPVFSPSSFNIFFQYFDVDGNLVLETDHYLVADKIDSFEVFDLKNILKTKISGCSMVASVRIVCNWTDKKKIPTRVKLGLNVGYVNRELKLPCNICFAPLLGNANILKKQGTFKWMPILNVHNSESVLTNSSPLLNYERNAVIHVKYYREMDNQFIEETIVIPPNGIKYIKVQENLKLKEFLDGSSGWMTAQSDNPFINGWYFDFSDSGSVAADHCF